LQAALEPRAGEPPVGLGGREGDVEAVCGLLDAQVPEKTVDDKACNARTGGFELFKSGVEFGSAMGFAGTESVDVKGDGAAVSSALESGTTTDMIREDAAHGDRGEGTEVGLVIEQPFAVGGDANERLMNKHSRLNADRPPVAEHAGGDAAELVVDDREKLIDCLAITEHIIRALFGIWCFHKAGAAFYRSMRRVGETPIRKRMDRGERNCSDRPRSGGGKGV